MKTNRNFSPSTIVLLVLTAGALPQAQAQSYFGSPVEGTLCHTGETVLFACPSGQKRIAVCATPVEGSLRIKGTWLIRNKGDVAN